MLNTAGLIQRFNLSSFTRRLLTGAFWNTLGGVASRGLNIFVVVLIARILGKKSFGEYTIILNTMIMFQVFAEFGLGLTATKYVAQFRYAEPEKAGRIIALSTASAIAFGFLITILSYVS
jgi:O-antigen/teichoic acid export membrane protein